jgi:hypothetical protein
MNSGPKGSRFDYLLQQHFNALCTQQNKICDRNHNSGLFFGKSRLQVQHYKRDQCAFTAGCSKFMCITETQQRCDSTKCTSLFFELIEAVHIAESPDEHTYGFTVGAKANPAAHDLPWVENVTPRIPNSGKLRLREKIVSVNGKSAAGLSAREVKQLVLASRLKLRIEVFGETEDESRIRSEILCRGRLGFFHEFAEIWCRKVDSSSCEFDMKAVQAYRDIQSALRTFISLLEGLDEAEHLINALGKKASISKGHLEVFLMIFQFFCIICHRPRCISIQMTLDVGQVLSVQHFLQLNFMSDSVSPVAPHTKRNAD